VAHLKVGASLSRHWGGEIFHKMLAGQHKVALAWIHGNKKREQFEGKHAHEAVHSAHEMAKLKESGTKSWAKGLLAGLNESGELSNQVGSELSQSFSTFGTQLAKGQINLAQAATFLGKAILKDVIDSVAARLMDKGEMQIALGAALLSAVFTAELAPQHFISGGMMLAAGIGLQMLSAALLAEGALVVRPTMAVIGEGGQPEAVIPADRFAEFGLTGGLKLQKMKLNFPDINSPADAQHPQFSGLVGAELQNAYRDANERKK
jgi:hypothetical protein